MQDLQIATPSSNEVRVSVSYAGLCHSDLHEMDGTFPTTTPIVLGHEASGVVQEVGSDVVDIAVGDHVVTCLSVFCGLCKYCVYGRQVLCENRAALAMQGAQTRLTDEDGRTVRPTAGIGAFAEQIVVHQNAVAVIPAHFPLSKASILGCAITTGYGAVVHSARVHPGSSVAIIGTGGIGMAAIQAARLAGAGKVIAIDVIDEKLVQASGVGATHVVNSGHVDVVSAVRDIAGAGVDYSFEAVGKAVTVEQAVAMLRPGGIATVVGMVPSDPPIQIDGADLFFSEKVLQGSFMGSNHFKTDIALFVELHDKGVLDLDAMITHVLPFAEINDGFALLAEGRSTRAVVSMGQL
ncbi:Zn-dependent alcohol dehydrogenase [Rhodococcus wratislaviensis]|uniref:Zn-dependent alcohol dehydrogenase n=1 Tax=Rhodococcus wratislaviensis TaxID=44752 RepID=UPI00364828A5